MDLSKLPIWLAYVVAPAVLLLFATQVIFNSESPFLIAAIIVACGLLCAAVVHPYVAFKKRFSKDEKR